MTHTNEYGSWLFAKFIAENLKNLDPETFETDFHTRAELVPDENVGAMTGASKPAGRQDEQKEIFDAMERAGDNLEAAVRKARKEAGLE